MHITQHTDYALRVLLHVGSNPSRRVTIAEIADRFDISRSHLMKVVNQLVREGMLDGQRGKGGGLSLAVPASKIRVGDVVRRMEPGLELVECFGTSGRCLLNPACKLKRALTQALDAFLKVLDGYTLEDLLDNPATIRTLRLVAVPMR
ncbi:MAG: RrF2 family transcriptional regulator [Gammaproteobacteria bacterium]|jgi:Rrf2 family nitric oxide-sensitive transcriptional repressor